MSSFLKFIFFFLLYGLVWFFLFSIPISKDNNVFLVLQKSLNLKLDLEKNEKTKKEINKERVIDAITNAFKP